MTQLKLNKGLNEYSKDSLIELIKKQHILADPVKKYLTENLNVYLKECIQKGYLIEAFALSHQYITNVVFDIIGFSKKEWNDMKLKPVIMVLRRLGVIKEEEFKLYGEYNSKRNKLVHKILDNPIEAAKLSKSKEYKNWPFKIIKIFDEILLRILKKKYKQNSLKIDSKIFKRFIKSVWFKELYKKTVKNFGVGTNDKEKKLEEKISEKIIFVLSDGNNE